MEILTNFLNTLFLHCNRVFDEHVIESNLLIEIQELSKYALEYYKENQDIRHYKEGYVQRHLVIT